jgi:predicted Zn-dependent protease with MMP-like domain
VSLDRRGRLERLRTARARRRDGDERFEQLVAQALDGLPSPFRERLENVAIVVEERPSDTTRRAMRLKGRDTLLGLYQGIPLPARGTGYTMALPDRITLYREPILERCRSADAVVDEVRATLLHELGHYFGLPDSQLR